MKKGYKRADRVGELLRRELSGLVMRELKDPRTQHVTITGADVSDDLHNARIYFNTALSESSPEEAKEGLERASGFLRREIGRRLDLRYTPRLTFQYDVSFDRGARLEETLREIPGTVAGGEKREEGDGED